MWTVCVRGRVDVQRLCELGVPLQPPALVVALQGLVVLAPGLDSLARHLTSCFPALALARDERLRLAWLVLLAGVG